MHFLCLGLSNHILTICIENGTKGCEGWEKKGGRIGGGKVDRRDGVEGWAGHEHEVQMGKGK